MLQLPDSILRLVSALRALPSVGTRTAERLALHLVQQESGAKAQALAHALVEAQKNISLCTECGFLCESSVCPICSNPLRQRHLLCIVENPMDVIAFEKTGQYQGLYHVLHGTLSPLDGIGPDELKIPQLLKRIEALAPQEIIIGLSPDMRGETTTVYLARELESLDIPITRLATGISAQTGLEFADSLTLTHALKNRQDMSATKL